MRYDNHRFKIDSRYFLGDGEGDNLTAQDDFQNSSDEKNERASKDLDFYIRKPFCGCSKCG